ncbi:MAG: FAD-dependent oxidoreductase [Fuerstia sp.]|nr:FAD-dependent oxidoreductase [Fuerstiella sp.]
MSVNERKRILILGGGFAGVYTAMYLDKLLRSDPDVEIALVSRENYFVFQPMLAEVISGNISLLDTVSPIHRLVPRCRLFIREIESVDLANRRVTLSPGFWPQSYVLEFDHLVLALGTVTDFRGITGLHQHALPFKNLADAVRLRNHLIHVLNEAEIETNPERRQQLLTFVIAGGGFSGVEVCAELNDFVRHMAKHCRGFSATDIRVVLVHSGKQILEREVGPRLSAYAQKILRHRGVELCLENRLKTATPDAAILASGVRIPTKTLVSTVPSFPNPLIDTLDLQKEGGRIVVDGHLEVIGAANIWALGDTARVPNAADNEHCPPTAQHAIRQAKTLAHNIAARINGREPKVFRFPGLGKMGSLGHHSAVAELFNRIRISGFPAWILWRTVYWWKLPGIDRKLKVGFSWLLDLLIPPETVQLRIESGSALAQLHFEPGEIVFRKGDLGDSLYIILRGEAEVIIESESSDHSRSSGENFERLATLGAGEYFGEIALLKKKTRSATVRCTKALDLLALPQGQFQALTTNLPDFKSSFELVMELRMKREAAEKSGAAD